jgi:hypothetical protein
LTRTAAEKAYAPSEAKSVRKAIPGPGLTRGHHVLAARPAPSPPAVLLSEQDAGEIKAFNKIF